MKNRPYKTVTPYFSKPQTPSQWVLAVFATGIVLSTFGGQRRFIRELKKHIKEKLREKSNVINDDNLSKILYKLKQRKFIKIAEKGDSIEILLTDKGRRYELKYKWNNIQIEPPLKWDQKWRFIMFDIPQADSNKRKIFREKLKSMGFIQFQKSIWIYPYSCEKEIDFISEYLNIGKHITMLTVKIDEDKPLREKFKLI